MNASRAEKVQEAALLAVLKHDAKIWRARFRKQCELQGEPVDQPHFNGEASPLSDHIFCLPYAVGRP